MRMAKAFEFTKNNYIKKYPDIFLDILVENINHTYKSDSISWDNLLTSAEFNKLTLKDIPIYANVSIIDKSIKVPQLLESFKFKKKIYELLDKTHEDVKKKIAEMRKSGKLIDEEKQSSLTTKSKEIISFDIR